MVNDKVQEMRTRFFFIDSTTEKLIPTRIKAIFSWTGSCVILNIYTSTMSLKTSYKCSRLNADQTSWFTPVKEQSFSCLNGRYRGFIKAMLSGVCHHCLQRQIAKISFWFCRKYGSAKQFPFKRSEHINEKGDVPYPMVWAT